MLSYWHNLRQNRYSRPSVIRILANPNTNFILFLGIIMIFIGILLCSNDSLRISKHFKYPNNPRSWGVQIIEGLLYVHILQQCPKNTTGKINGTMWTSLFLSLILLPPLLVPTMKLWTRDTSTFHCAIIITISPVIITTKQNCNRSQSLTWRSVERMVHVVRHKRSKTPTHVHTHT